MSQETNLHEYTLRIAKNLGKEVEVDFGGFSSTSKLIDIVLNGKGTSEIDYTLITESKSFPLSFYRAIVLVDENVKGSDDFLDRLTTGHVSPEHERVLFFDPSIIKSYRSNPDKLIPNSLKRYAKTPLSN
jgi:hypothetical protein